MQEPSAPSGEECNQSQSDDELPKIDLGGQVSFSCDIVMCLGSEDTPLNNILTIGK